MNSNNKNGYNQWAVSIKNLQNQKGVIVCAQSLTTVLFFMIKKIVIALVLGLCFVKTTEAAVNIAVIAPKSGDFSDAARDLTDGVRTAVSEINAQGGLLGQKINLIEVDDQCDDRFNVSMAQMMAVNSSAEDKMNLVIGPYCHNQFAKVAEIYAQAQIMQIIPLPLDGEKSAVLQDGLLKLSGCSTEQANEFFDYYRLKFINRNTALVYDGRLRFAVEIAAAVQKRFADQGLSNRLTSYNFANYGKDYTQMAREILLNNQVVYILGDSKETAKLTREIGEMKNGTPVFTDRYNLRENYTDIVDAGQDGLHFLALENLKDNPQFAETLVRLRLQGREPRGLGVYGYLSVNLWKNLVVDGKSFNYKTVAAAASAGKISLPWGNVKFEKGNPDKPAPYGVYGFRGGEYTQVY